MAWHDIIIAVVISQEIHVCKMWYTGTTPGELD